MKKEDHILIDEFKRLIHVLTTGKRTPVSYGSVKLYRAEAHILEIIGKTEGVTSTDIVRKFDVTKGAVSQLIVKLCRKGLVQKQFREGNLKTQELSLTALGHATLLAHEKHEHDLLIRLEPQLDLLPPAVTSQLAGIVRDIADFIKN